MSNLQTKQPTSTPGNNIAPDAGSVPKAIANLRVLPAGQLGQQEPKRLNSTISAFIELQAEARAAASVGALRFTIVNATRRMIDFTQALLLETDGASGWKVTLASSVARVDRNALRVRAIEAWAGRPRELTDPKIDTVHPVSLPGTDGNGDADPELKSGLWIPIKNRTGIVIAVLLILKADKWRPEDAMLLDQLGGAYGHAWAALRPARGNRFRELVQLCANRRVAAALSVAAAVCLIAPVPLTSLAPAEIVAAAPSIVAAPMDGVVQEILVAPGSMVQPGTVLLRFVDTKLRNDFEISQRAKDVAEARYFKALQSALSSHKEMEDIAIAQGELAVAKAELAASEDMLTRSEVRAEKAGLVIYSSPADWIGKPVQIGERIMEIGDPSKVEVRIDLPVSDSIALRAGSAVGLFLDGEPLEKITAAVTRTSYRPIVSPEQQMIYRIYAEFEDQTARRIGLRGTARVSGNSVPLFYYFLRRPLSSLRQRVGW
jgi:multidrug efflux pump subunit AcrA (membrane-fusion protein)